MRPGSGRSIALALAVLFASRPARTARGQAIGQGFELERQGRVAQAAALYEGVLRAEPANVPALLGLERVLPTLGRLRELLPFVRAALAADSSVTIRGLALRVFTAAEEDDSAAALARGWAAQRPHDPAPWREWAIALEDHQRFDDARNVLIEGRQALGLPGALAIELAELAQRTGDWQAAALEWVMALAAAPDQLANAVSQLEDTPQDQRERVVRVLTTPGASVAVQRTAASLLLGWGQPEVAWATFFATLADSTPETAIALRNFADRASGAAPGIRRVRGLALAQLAELMPGPLAARVRADAARALLAAGDRAAARAVLTKLAADRTAPADAQGLAHSALIEALIEDGQLDSAANGLARLDSDGRATSEERARLRHALVGAWIRAGRLEPAEDALGADSSVEALALRGWVKLYRGELKPALDAFRSAGPYAGDRDAATARTAMIALLEQLGIERSPELGAALLALARGDSSDALGKLRRVATRLRGARGRPDVLLLAGQVAARLGGSHEGVAGDLFAEAVRTGGVGAAAPAAELEWARLLLRQAHPGEAVAHLEHLILTYPGSAVVPEARQELERAKGAIPRS